MAEEPVMTEGEKQNSPNPGIGYTVEYKSSRKDVWKRYWLIWKVRLWKYQVSFFVALIILSLLSGGHYIVRAAITGIVAIIIFMFYPQIMFKPQTRKLLIRKEGIQTSIGKLHGNIPWEDISAIEETSEVIIITRKNQNAFMIPRQAFKTDKDMHVFTRLCRLLRAAVLDGVR